MKQNSLLQLAVVATSAALLSCVPLQAQHQPVNPIKTITIGQQVWMAENLSVSTFRNGDTIPQAKTRAEWNRAGAQRKPAWCYYNNDSTLGAVYGKLYNWFAVVDPRGLAPAGWHIPSAEEWLQLRAYLGGKRSNAGQQLKSTTGWSKKGNGTNVTGFTALPGGGRSAGVLINQNEGFLALGNAGFWWSSNRYKNTTDRFVFLLTTDNKATYHWDDGSEGLSVRCVRD